MEKISAATDQLFRTPGLLEDGVLCRFQVPYWNEQPLVSGCCGYVKILGKTMIFCY